MPSAGIDQRLTMLARRAHAGDRVASCDFARTAAPWLRDWCAAYSLNPQMAVAVAQEALDAALDALDGRLGGQPRAWLLSFAAPRIDACLRAGDRLAGAARDPLTHVVATACLDDLARGAVDADPGWLERSGLSAVERLLVQRRYAERLPVDQLVHPRAGGARMALITLMCARARVLGTADLAAQVAEADPLLCDLVERWLSRSIDAASCAALAQRVIGDLSAASVFASVARAHVRLAALHDPNAGVRMQQLLDARGTGVDAAGADAARAPPADQDPAQAVASSARHRALRSARSGPHRVVNAPAARANARDRSGYAARAGARRNAPPEPTAARHAAAPPPATSGPLLTAFAICMTIAAAAALLSAFGPWAKRRRGDVAADAGAAPAVVAHDVAAEPGAAPTRHRSDERRPAPPEARAPSPPSHEGGRAATASAIRPEPTRAREPDAAILRSASTTPVPLATLDDLGRRHWIGSEATRVEIERRGHAAGAALRYQTRDVPGAWPWFSSEMPRAVDVRGTTALAVELRGTATGHAYEIEIHDGRAAGAREGVGQKWIHAFVDDRSEWRVVVLPWTGFRRKHAANADAPTDGRALSEVVGWAVTGPPPGRGDSTLRIRSLAGMR